MDQDGGWKSGRKGVDKSLLKNIIRHTDAHNKIQEQNEMWKQWELKKHSHERNESYKHDGRPRGYMRSDIGSSSAAKKESRKWNRFLQDYEETRKDRWGHSGYEELYPDEFQQGNEIESDESETKEKIKNKSEGSNREKPKKKENKSKMKKSRRAKSDSFDSDVETDRNYRKSSINSKTEGLGNDIKIRHNRERKMKHSEDKKSKRFQSKESRKIGSDSTAHYVESRRNVTNTKELENDFKTGSRKRDRKMEVDFRNSKMKRLDGREKSQSKCIDNDLNCRDRKRKIISDSGLKNDQQDKKLRSNEFDGRDESPERSGRKRNTENTSRKSGCTDETSYSSRKKNKLKH